MACRPFALKAGGAQLYRQSSGIAVWVVAAKAASWTPLTMDRCATIAPKTTFTDLYHYSARKLMNSSDVVFHYSLNSI